MSFTSSERESAKKGRKQETAKIFTSQRKITSVCMAMDIVIQDIEPKLIGKPYRAPYGEQKKSYSLITGIEEASLYAHLELATV